MTNFPKALNEMHLITGSREDMHLITVDDVPDHLKGYISDPDGLSWTWFHHPALILHLPTVLPVPLDEAVATRVAAIQQARRAGDWAGYVFRHERPYRFDAFLSLMDDWPNELDTARGSVRFWKLAAEVWTDGEADESDPCWEWIMEAPVPNRHAMSSSAARRHLRALAARGGEVDVFRGVQAQDDDTALSNALGGWQWTTSRHVAAWFAWRWLQDRETPLKPWVARARVPVDQIAALLTGRGEDEALIDPAFFEEHDADAVTIEPAGEFPGHYSKRKDKIT
jgi:hypothetical protein